MKNSLLIIVSLVILFASCKDASQANNKGDKDLVFQNKGHELVHKMVQKVGTYAQLNDKKNVSYTYTYITSDGKTDIVNEKYIFDGELSYGKYEKHERTISQLEGIIEQGFDGNEFWLKHNGELIADENLLKKVAFNRPTNFYWFTMMQKLLDPGLIYEYLGEKTIDNKVYDIVKISFKAQSKPTDIYQVYINKKTALVDQFLFTVADYGKMEIPKLMLVEYEEVDGFLIPTKRKYQSSTWNADRTDNPWVKVTWKDIKFNTGITESDFKK